MENAVVDVLDASTDAVVGTDDTDANGNYAVTVPAGTYDVRVTPPEGSDYQIAIVRVVILTTSQTLNIVLVLQPEGPPVPPTPVFHTYVVNVRDPNGALLCGLSCNVYLETSDGTRYTSTVNLSLLAHQIQAPAGIYKVGVVSSGSDTYSMNGVNAVFELNGDMTQDVMVNQGALNVAVVDQNGDPVPNARVSVDMAGGAGTQLLPDYQVVYGNNQALASTSGTGVPAPVKVLPGSPVTSVVVDSAIGAFDTVTVDEPTVVDGTITVQVHTNPLPPPPPPNHTWNGKLKGTDGSQLFCGGIGNNCVYFEASDGTRYSSSANFSLFTYQITAPSGSYKVGVDGGSTGTYNMRGETLVMDLSTDVNQDFVVNREPVDVAVVDQNGSPVGSARVVLHTSGGTGTQLFPDHQVTYGENAADGYTGATGEPAAVQALTGSPVTTATVSDASSTVDFSTVTVDDPITVDGVITVVVHTEVQPPPPVVFTYTVNVKDGDGNYVCGLTCNVVLTASDGTAYSSFVNLSIPSHQVQAPPGTYKVSVTGPDSSAAMTGDQPVLELTGDLTRDLIVHHVTLHVQVIDQNNNPIPNARIRVDTAGGTGTQLLPGYQVAYGENYSYAYTSSTGAPAAVKVLLGSPITSIEAASSNGAFGTITLGPRPAMTQDGNLVIHLQPPGAPTVPLDLTAASPTNEPPALGWGAVSGATSYKVFRDGVEVGAADGTSFTDDTVPADGSYGYTVAACNSSACGGETSSIAVVHDTTPPVLGVPDWGEAPVIQQGHNAAVGVDVSDSLSGVAAGEYFIGTDPGAGHGTPLSLVLEGTHLGASFGADLAPGTYAVGLRARDQAGNWSAATSAGDLVVQAPAPQTFTLSPTGDAYVRSGQSDHNQGGSQFMQIQSSGGNRGLVRFDQSALQASVGSGTVLSAKLRLRITDNADNWGPTGRPVDVHRLLRDWAEGNGTEDSRGTGSGATWNCAVDSLIQNQATNCAGTTAWEMGQPNNPAVHPWASTATASQNITNGQSGVVEYDVTADVAAFVNGTQANYGWLVKKTNEGQNGQVSFGTRESAFGAELVITFQP
jgi:protocatechuate 3,4-dioxygenase beta subunit